MARAGTARGPAPEGQKRRRRRVDREDAEVARTSMAKASDFERSLSQSFVGFWLLPYRLLPGSVECGSCGLGRVGP